MDWASHRLLGEYLCSHFGFPQEYVEWSIAPDIDRSVMHRYWRHRFTTFKDLYKEFSEQNPSVPTQNKVAIATLICSHFLLDIYTAPLFCFGFYFPSSHIPPEFIKELLEEEKYPKDELLVKEEMIFTQFIRPRSEEMFMNGVIELLAEHARFVPAEKVEEARRSVEEFCDVKLTEIYDLREFDDAFFRMLNEFFASH